MKKTLRTGKKVCSVFLAVLMVLTAWVFVAPEKAEAATAGKYYYKVTFQVTDDMDNVQMKSTLYGRGNNGTSGSEVTIATKNYTSDTKFSGTMTIMEGTTDAGVFPTRFHIYDNNGAKYFIGFGVIIATNIIVNIKRVCFTANPGISNFPIPICALS